MKLTKISNLMLLGLTLTIAAAGCKTHHPDVTELPANRPTPLPVGPGPITGGPGTGGNPGPVNPTPPVRTQPPIGGGPPVSGGPDIKSETIPVVPTPLPPPTNDVPVPVESFNNLHPPTGGHQDWVPDRDSLRAQTVYFDFDKSTVKAGEEGKINAVADYLRSNPGAALLIEGNCDERGTEEYNRSLGERRALATREVLIRLGIEAGRLDTVTYGEDRPAELGHNEAAWSKNRRDEFVVLTPPKP